MKSQSILFRMIRTQGKKFGGLKKHIDTEVENSCMPALFSVSDALPDIKVML